MISMEGWSEEISTFRSACEWPDLRPPVEYATGELKPLSCYLSSAFEMMACAGEIAQKCDDSPIEVELGARLLKTIRALGETRLRLFPQYVIEPFRYDFGIVLGEKLIALIECDGRDFHTTDEQIKNDRAKGKLAAEIGVRLFRLSGAEILRDSKSCARRILNDILLKRDLTRAQWDILADELAPRSVYFEDE
jgi:very-short-patch-repair endonuclease